MIEVPDGPRQLVRAVNAQLTASLPVFCELKPPDELPAVPERKAKMVSAFTAEAMIQYGSLRVYRPDYHCWVYQYEGCLYWIVDQDFYFEDDGSTYIQYQLWTTKEELLPQRRIENGWMWDNIGGYFEDYEIEEESGYRIMKRELPTAYPITSIVTGYYKNNEWIWKEYFRPYYEFN